MKIEGQRRSNNFEDRGSGGGGGGGLPVRALGSLVQFLGVKGTLIVGAIAAGGYFLLPSGVRSMLLSALTGAEPVAGTQAGGSAGLACRASESNASACDFSLAVLGSTEDVWSSKFQSGDLPRYNREIGAYQTPTLVVFSGQVSTGGCGGATSGSGPFYCPADRKLYIDPTFYLEMERTLKAPGDFAQAYVIAHEVGHHIQNLIGSTAVKLPGETANQNSVRVELQADCLAGVWGQAASKSLEVDEADLKEAVNAAHAIGDDALGHENEKSFTHGSSEQRMRWFRRGFEHGDARKCDTFAVSQYNQL
jgi:uncharacterized protein